MINLEIKTYNILGINLRGKTSGQIKTECPFCQNERKNKHDKPFSVNIETGVYKCHHCEKSGNIHEFTTIKEYRKPERPKELTFEEKTLKWFNNRGISKETLDKSKVIITDRKFSGKENSEKCICFQYFNNDVLINNKYRSATKEFSLEAGAEIIPYNVDCLNLEVKYLIIVEGEIDCLSWIEKGFNSVISVPNGASNNVTYLDEFIDKILSKEKIIIATDADTKGFVLRDSLISRIGAEKCFNIDYKGVKDTNEYLIKHNELQTLFNSAKPIQIEGVKDLIDVEYKLDNLFESGYNKGFKLFIPKFDELILWELGKLVIYTGIPSSGKSEMVDFICVRLNAHHNWKIAYFSPEHEQEIHIVKLIDKLTGKSFFNKEVSKYEYEIAKEYINNNYFWIQPKDENYTLDEILKNAEFLIKQKNIKVLVIDPYNTVEHLYDNNNETLYINKFLARLTNFKKKHNILLFLVAHPRKMENIKGNFKKPTLYDISGSANFYNKADYGLVQHIDINKDISETLVQKVKNKWMGKKGRIEWIYNQKNGRYTMLGDIEDNSSFFETA
jgi:twinkle protein